MRLRRLAATAAAILLPYGGYEWLRNQPELDLYVEMPHGHFYVVTAVSFLALLIAVVVGIVGSRLRNLQVCFLSLAFISMAEVFMVHGLSTPNLILHATHLPGVASQMSVLLASLWLWLSALSSNHPIVRYISGFQQKLTIGWTLALAVAGVYFMLHPHAVDFIPLTVRPLNYSLVMLTVLFNLWAIYRYYRSYLYSRFPLQLAIILSSGWLIVAQFIIITGQSWRLSWWSYHFLLLGSMLVMIAGLIRQYTAKRSFTAALRALFITDPVERITSNISPSIQALMAATEQKDMYTAGHNFRVTRYALMLAEELQLGPAQLRALAQGTIIHDVGKIRTPDSILNKPGMLTPEERRIIELHPIHGFDMCKGLGFMKEELEIIRYHHECWDGTGYPDQLKGESIPLMARIVAVADVYDALTSERAYRAAMPHAEAMSFIAARSGSQFDPVCVKAWVRLCERQPLGTEDSMRAACNEAAATVSSAAT
ncbi:HD-GYP domain-containing protein [Paenibacillus sp. YYML68]|uniref:HD-GYP domain-containing protein n=1 Tax=Paenibacillus sp. YYML68 TaxID=2909250 RepID=UPI00248FE49E|nr:HD-GYP domain-containing protein [Paenibacillus sp. YYML68]